MWVAINMNVYEEEVGGRGGGGGEEGGGEGGGEEMALLVQFPGAIGAKLIGRRAND